MHLWATLVGKRATLFLVYCMLIIPYHKYHIFWPGERGNRIYIYYKPILSISMLPVFTDWYSSTPMAVHAERADVPVFILLKDAHFSPKWTPKSSSFPRSTERVASLSFVTGLKVHGIVTQEKNINSSYQIQLWWSISCNVFEKKTRNANPEGWVRSMKLDLLCASLSWSIKSKRTALYWVMAIGRVKLPWPAKNSNHS